MKKRFVLSAAGVSAAAIGGAANAEVVSFMFHYDYYTSEAGWSITDSASNVVLSAIGFANGTALSVSGAAFVSSGFGDWNSTNVAYSGYYHEITADLAAGNYNIVLTDTWGDGWEYFDNTGLDAFAYGSYQLAFTTGGSVGGSFTVVPAPGALALLGLAGVAGVKRRRN